MDRRHRNSWRPSKELPCLMFRPPKPLRRTSKAPSTSASSNADFPYFQYLSVLGTLTLLLSFTSVILPASTSIFTTLPPQQSSLDKPQHRLLIPITASPIWTMIWLCMGTAVCQAWWAGWMRTWWANYPRLGFTRSGENEEDEEKRLLRRDPAKIPVCIEKIILIYFSVILTIF